MENRYSREQERARRRKVRQLRQLIMILEFVVIIILAISLIVVSTKYKNLKQVLNIFLNLKIPLVKIISNYFYIFSIIPLFNLLIAIE